MSSRGFIAVLFAFMFIAGLAAAQTQPAPAQPAPSAKSQTAKTNSVAPESTPAVDSTVPIETFHSRSDEVNVIFTVTDKHNKFIKDLKENQFKILDNNRPPKQITNFSAETDLPLRVGLLIDASNSIRDRFLFEQDAAISFLHQIIRPNTDKAFVLAFDEVWDLTQDFTGDLDKLTRGVKVIRPGGGTAMWDAVFYACRDKLMKEKETGPVRRAIILVSDGDDNQSRVLRQEAIEMAQRAGVIVYTISTNLSNNPDEGDRSLKMLAETTGGQAFFPFKLQDVANAFHDINEELRSQYSVFYKPADFEANGQFRPIQIVADNKKYKVRAKKGYFVPRQ
ncbi:MAG TPA: VWA domain-containing protein [Candidatus Angelobacter sp.]|nr:VWA domain-containing protein [Candidatus Angelobacter sp.]